jgi:hypothetical protein
MALRHQIAGFAVSAVVSTVATAQIPPMLQPIDQTVADVNPLSASLRQVHRDLRQPTGFQSVYHVPGHDDLLMRVNGGIYAVFPESEYTVNRKGRTVPLIPAGTVFYIGLPNKLTTPPGRSSNAHTGIEPTVRLVSQIDSRSPVDAPVGVVNTMLDMKIGEVDQNGKPLALAQQPLVQNDPQPAAMPDPSRFAGPTIVNDSSYRARRLDELLQRAARSAGHQDP